MLPWKLSGHSLQAYAVFGMLPEQLTEVRRMLAVVTSYGLGSRIIMLSCIQ